MPELLKSILGEAYTDEIGKRISEEIEKAYVPKEVYDSVISGKEETGNTADSTDSLKEVIKKHEQTILSLKNKISSDRKTNALKEKLRECGAIDPEYIIFKHGGVDAFTYSENGEPTDIEKVAECFKRNASTAFLFAENAGEYKPASGAVPSANPFAKETFNLTEQGKLLRENPSEAKRMAAAVKIKI